MVVKMKTRTIRQKVLIKAAPEDVYDALMNPKKHSKFTGSKVKISPRVGGRFFIFDGGLSGTNLALVKNRKIVQKWHCRMEDWPEKHYSKATFSFRKIKGGTQLALTQTSVPAACYWDISQGWKIYYWKPMKKMLEKKKS
jgi:activator of HSP90 ATPase